MKKRFFIIMGRSGSGKGTQAKFLQELLEQNSFDDVRHITTGAGFRTFNAMDVYSSRLSKEVTNNGGLNPEFLAIWNWTSLFLQEIQENTTVILDGAPRKMIEVEALRGALSFYGYEKPIVIYLDTSEAWATERLIGREREDDAKKEGREQKMQWFLDNVLPCIAYFKNDTNYDFIHVLGEKTKEEVAEEVREKVTSLLLA